MNRTVYVLIILILATALIGGYFWWLSLEKDNLPQSSTRELGKIASATVVSPVNSYDNDAIWYGLNNGRMMWYDINTRVQTEYPLPMAPGESFKRIFWPPQGNDFIVLSTVSGQPQYNYFNYSEKKYVVLPNNIATLDWTAKGAKIVIIWKSGDGKTYLVTSNPDASGYRIVRELPWPDMTINSSPSGETALLMRSAIGESNKIYLFNLETGEYSEAVDEGRNTSVTWSSKGDRFAFTRLENGNSTAYIHDFLNDTDVNLEISASQGKMTFSADGDSLYVAALGEDAKREDLWKVNLVTQDREVIFSSDTLRMKNIIVIGQKIYFLDQNDVLYGYE